MIKLFLALATSLTLIITNASCQTGYIVAQNRLPDISQKYIELDSGVHKLKITLHTKARHTYKNDSAKGEIYYHLINKTNHLINSLDSVNYLLEKQLMNNNKEIISISDYEHYSNISLTAIKKISSTDYSNIASIDTFLNKAYNQMKTINYTIDASTAGIDTRVPVEVKVYDNYENRQQVPGWRAHATFYFSTETIDLNATTNAGGKMRAGEVIIKLFKGNSKIQKEHFLDATDQRTWVIEVYLSDYNY